MTWSIKVVLPEDSGPKISTTRPRGRPPTPRARSSDNAPVWMDSMPIEVFSPIRMMDPFPNCLSMAATAISSAFSRSLLTVVLRFLSGAWVILLTWWPSHTASISIFGLQLGLRWAPYGRGVTRLPGHCDRTVMRLALLGRHKCNYEQSFDQAL